MLPEAWGLDVLADGGGSVAKILNGAFVSNFMVSGVFVVLVSTKRWASGVCPSSYSWEVGNIKIHKEHTHPAHALSFHLPANLYRRHFTMKKTFIIPDTQTSVFDLSMKNGQWYKDTPCKRYIFQSGGWGGKGALRDEPKRRLRRRLCSMHAHYFVKHSKE